MKPSSLSYAYIVNFAKADRYYFIFDVAASYLQYHGTQQGSFFSLDTFEPLVNNDGIVFNNIQSY